MEYDRDEHTFKFSIHETRQLFDCLENEDILKSCPDYLKDFFIKFLDDFTFALDSCQGDAHIQEKSQTIKFIIG